MIGGSDKFSQALTLMCEAFDDTAVGAMFVPGADLAAEVDAAQKVINAASAVQVLRVAQYVPAGSPARRSRH